MAPPPKVKRIMTQPIVSGSRSLAAWHIPISVSLVSGCCHHDPALVCRVHWGPVVTAAVIGCLTDCALQNAQAVMHVLSCHMCILPLCTPQLHCFSLPCRT
jgi:hypothetical protein